MELGMGGEGKRMDLKIETLGQTLVSADRFVSIKGLDHHLFSLAN